MPYEPIVPDGQNLGRSHSVDGAVTGHLFEDGKLQGHASWRWVDEPDESTYSGYSSSGHDDDSARPLTDEEIEALGQIIALIIGGIIAGTTAAAPHVRRWWGDRVVPAMRRGWTLASAPVIRMRRGRTPQAATPAPQVFIASADGVELALPESAATLPRTMWEDGFRTALAPIRGGAGLDASAGLATARGHRSERLTPVQFADQVRRVLAANPELLTPETAADIARIFASKSSAVIPADFRGRASHG